MCNSIVKHAEASKARFRPPLFLKRQGMVRTGLITDKKWVLDTDTTTPEKTRAPMADQTYVNMNSSPVLPSVVDDVSKSGSGSSRYEAPPPPPPNHSLDSPTMSLDVPLVNRECQQHKRRGVVVIKEFVAGVCDMVSQFVFLSGWRFFSNDLILDFW